MIVKGRWHRIKTRFDAHVDSTATCRPSHPLSCCQKYTAGLHHHLVSRNMLFLLSFAIFDGSKLHKHSRTLATGEIIPSQSPHRRMGSVHHVLVGNAINGLQVTPPVGPKMRPLIPYPQTHSTLVLLYIPPELHNGMILPAREYFQSFPH